MFRSKSADLKARKPRGGVLFTISVVLIYNISIVLIQFIFNQIRISLFLIPYPVLHIILLLISLVSVLSAFGITILYIKKVGRLNPFSGGNFKITRRFYIWPIVITVIIFTFSGFLTFQMMEFYIAIDRFISKILKSNFTSLYETIKIFQLTSYSDYSLIGIIIIYLQVVIIAPIFEEIVFRGICLSGLIRKYPPWFAILFQAILFTLTHAQLNLSILLMGIYTGFLVFYYRSLIPGIIIHALNNLVVITIQIIYSKFSNLHFSVGIAIVILGCIFISLINYLVFRLINRNSLLEPEVINFKEKFSSLFSRKNDSEIPIAIIENGYEQE
jgi:hypothetical protein